METLGSEIINIIKKENPEWFDEEFEASYLFCM
jgi:hypothetical protein